MSNGSNSSSDSNNIWLWLGGGCALVLIVGGILLSFGAYKGVTCCQSALERQKKARQFALSFAEDIQGAKYDKAWSKTSERLRLAITKDDLTDRVERVGAQLAETMLRVEGLNQQIGGTNKDTSGSHYVVDVAFMPRAGTSYVVMKTRLINIGKSEQPEFRVDEVEFVRRARKMAAEPPAQVVQRFNKNVADGNMEGALNQVDGDAFAAGESTKTLKTYVAGEGALLEKSSFAVVDVRYEPGEGATVDARHELPDGSRQLVRYRVAKEGVRWRIAGVEIGVEPHQQPDVQEVESQTDASDERDAGSGAETGPSGDR